MSKTEDQVYTYYQVALEKFDYFILGIVVVVCGFLSKEIDFSPIGYNVETIQLFSLILFGVAGFASFKRTENQISQYKFNYLHLVHKRESNSDEILKFQKKIDRVMYVSYIYYSVRNICFLMGFVVYIFSKIFSSYINS